MRLDTLSISLCHCSNPITSNREQHLTLTSDDTKLLTCTYFFRVGLIQVIFAGTNFCETSQNLAACYQLAQSVLKIGFALAKKVGYGEVGGFQCGVLCTWQLPWLSGCRKALVGTSSSISFPFDIIIYLFDLYMSSISGTVGSLQSEEAFTGRRALTIVSLLTSGRGRGHDT